MKYRLRCFLFGHLFQEVHIYKRGGKVVGTIREPVDNCVYCCLSKEECGIKIKHN